MMEEQTKGCVICLQNYTVCESLKFIPLSTTVVNDESYLNKIHYMALYDRELQETWEICSDCSEALDKSCEFRKKLVIAVEFWKNWHTKIQTQDVAIAFGNSVSEDGTNRNMDSVYLNEVTTQQVSSETVAETDTLVCEVCLQIFQRTSDMLLHVCSQTTEVRSPKLEKNVCDLCDMNFTSESDFKYHVRNVHTAPKVYLCTVCNKVFKHSHNLREHLSSHTGERNYTCNICNKTFHRLSSQNRHMQTHLAPPGEKTKKSPYLCSICGKSFPFSNGFQRHMRTHVAEKRHQCTICSRAFSQSTHLKVHLRTHSGEKPYMCCVCKASFSLKATLRKHMKGHKDSEDYVKMVHTLEPNLGQSKGS